MHTRVPAQTRERSGPAVYLRILGLTCVLPTVLVWLVWLVVREPQYATCVDYSLRGCRSDPGDWLLTFAIGPISLIAVAGLLAVAWIAMGRALWRWGDPSSRARRTQRRDGATAGRRR